MKASSEVRFHLKSVPIQSGGKVPIDELGTYTPLPETHIKEESRTDCN